MIHLARLSYVLLSAVLLIVVAVYWVGSLAETERLSIWLGLLAVLSGAWIWLRQGQMTPNPEKRVRRGLRSGRPLLVHFCSDYALVCLIQRPTLTRLQRRVKGRVEAVAVDLNAAEGRSLAREFGAGAGTVLLFDRSGQEVYRSLFPTLRAVLPYVDLHASSR